VEKWGKVKSLKDIARHHGRGIARRHGRGIALRHGRGVARRHVQGSDQHIGPHHRQESRGDRDLPSMRKISNIDNQVLIRIEKLAQFFSQILPTILAQFFKQKWM
jgi:hypothetical protein